ncbi:MAG: hypothetical protein GF411_14175 [Candidatus Lokiarchaeota archaeon]|nr:hypothetical protein [Candidatus Lokiarchaeota archaeon]
MIYKIARGYDPLGKMDFNTGHMPVILRTRNRHTYLHITISSLELSGAKPDLIVDDRSDDDDAHKYLFTNDPVDLNLDMWPRIVRKPQTNIVRGIYGKYETIQPPTRKGARGGIYWSAAYGFARFPQSAAIILVEADVLFCDGWYHKFLEEYHKSSRDVGIISGFKCSRNYTAQLWLITRDVYVRSYDDFHKHYKTRQTGGDIALRKSCEHAGLKIIKTPRALCQHIGYQSVAHPRRARKGRVLMVKPSLLYSKLCIPT